jgi:Putative MetA-pathway of phenol degradation
MSKRLIVLLLACIAFCLGNAQAQSVCPLNGTLSGKLVCVLPQVYGAYGLGSGATAPLLADGHQAHFEGDFLSSFGPINEAVGIQVSQLPIASPSSGITFVYDPSLKTFAPSAEESLGPILGERASTIGRRKVYVAFSFQYFNFNSIDGQNTGKLSSVFQHEVFPPPPPPSFITACANQTGMTGTKYEGNPCFVRDFIQTTNNIDLTVHQYTMYATYGLTGHLDFSIEVPFLNVSIKANSNAQIVQNSFAPAGNPNFPGGVFHQFDPVLVPSCGSSSPCLNASFANSGTSTGIGDVTLRGKYQVYRGERLGFAGGVDVRLPTGDEQNFLGSGAVGVKPFGVVSYSARVSPHAEIGYEVNGKSILAGNFVGTNTNTKGSLPNRFVYTVGADVSIVKRLTGAFDLYGQRLFGAPQIFSNPYTDLGHCGDVSCSAANFTAGTTHPDLGVRTSVDYNILNASFGLKYRLVRQLIITGNVLVKLNDNGLRASAIPLVGASYSF